MEETKVADLKKALKFVKQTKDRLEDDYQHYTMVDKDETQAFYTKCDLEEFRNIEKCLDIKKDNNPEEWHEYTGKANYGLMCTTGEFKPLDEVIEEHPKLAEGFKDDKEWSALFERELKALKELKEVTEKMYELDVKAGEEIAEQIANGTF